MKKFLIVLSYLAFLMLDTQFTKAQDCANGMCTPQFRTPVRNVVGNTVKLSANVVGNTLQAVGNTVQFLAAPVQAPMAQCVENCNLSVCDCNQSVATQSTVTTYEVATVSTYEVATTTSRKRFTPVRNVLYRLRHR